MMDCRLAGLYFSLPLLLVKDTVTIGSVLGKVEQGKYSAPDMAACHPMQIGASNSGTTVIVSTLYGVVTLCHVRLDGR
jgi:hypothetical protein